MKIRLLRRGECGGEVPRPPLIQATLPFFRNPEFLVVALGRIVQMAISVASLRVVTEFLTPDEVGRRYLFVSLTAFFALMLINPVGMYINRRTHAWIDDGSIFQKLSLYWRFLLGVAVLAFSCLFVLSQTIGIGIQTSAFWLLILTSGSLLIGTSNITVVTLLNMMNARVSFVVYSTATILVGLLASVMLAVMGMRTAEYWLLGTLIGQVLIFMLAYSALRAKVSPSRDVPLPPLIQWKTYTTLFAFAWPLSIAVGLNWVQTQSYRFLLIDRASLHALGLFATGYAVSAALISAFEALFSSYYLPIYYRSVSSGEPKVVEQAWSILIAYMMPLAFLVTLFVLTAGPFLIHLMVHSEFKGIETYLIWGAAAECARVLGNAYSLLAHARLEMRALLLPNLLGASVAVGGIFLLGSFVAPAIAVGVSLALAGLSVLLCLHIHFTQRLSLIIPWRESIAALALSTPMLAMGAVLRWAWPTPSAQQAILALGALSVLLCAGSLVLVWVSRQRTRTFRV